MNHLSKTRSAFVGFLRFGLVLLGFLARGDSGIEWGYFDGRLWRLSVGSAVQSQVAVDEEGRLFISGAELGVDSRWFPSLARWGGREWQVVATNVSFPVIRCVGRQLVGAGRFSRIGSVTATNIARWEEGRWFPLGPGITGTIRTLAAQDHRLFVGGALTNAGPLAVTNVAAWDFVSETWSVLGNGLPGEVSSLAATPEGLYAGWNATGLAHVSRWTGAEWELVGTLGGVSVPLVSDLIWHQGGLVVAGGFTTINGLELRNVARWRGGVWEAVGDNELNSFPKRLAVVGDDLFAGGDFGILADGPFSRSGVLRLRNDHWEVSLGSEASPVTALAGRGSELFAVGSLTGGPPIGAGGRRIYWQFDGERWSPQNGGLTEIVETFRLARHGDGVVVAVSGTGPGPYLFYDGARFLRTVAGLSPNGTPLGMKGGVLTSDERKAYSSASYLDNGVATPIVARLEGSTWVPATQPLPFPIAVMGTGGGRIFAAGRDPARPGSTATAVLAWDGQAWERLGGTFFNPEIPFTTAGLIASIAWFDGALYAGGSFTSVDGVALARLARWNGNAWEPAGEFDAPVTALAATPDALHVVGTFTRVGELLTRRYANWNGQSWQTLGGGVGFMVPSAVAVNDDGLIAVAGQTSFNSSPGRRLLFWRGDHWETPEQGNVPDYRFNHLLWIGNDLYLAPTHPIVGPTESIGLAIWHENGPRLLPTLKDNSLALRVTGGTSSRFAVERSVDFQNWSPFATNALGNPGQHFRDPAPPTEGAFYRVRELE